MTFIKDLIDIPDRVQRGDFVLKLTEGVTDPAETLKDYVVTPELVKCFDGALTFIRAAVQGRTSKATYLHGSFGSGKSHFMAVLHLILQGNNAARAIPELAGVITKHNDWLAGKKFLLVPYHMIGAHDMESGILGNYVEFMAKRHPEAPTPPVYASDAIIRQAFDERASYGDELFFKRLNAGQEAGASAWGDLDAAWDAASFEQAAKAPADSESHLRLVSTLLKTIATSHAEVISHRGGNFVRFDKGLSIISKHASDLGYSALILFLDELILWLATNSANLGFVQREASKLTNLVEAQTADRPIPLVSFVARQRDLRELVGDHVPGAEKLSFSDSLDWQQGRFDTITLEDRNLPAIAERRVLKVKSKAAKDELDAAFEQTARMKENVMTILLTEEGDRQMFRKVYPFSPALVQTLIAVSSVLQRERTALKVMMQLLVDHRETLTVGELIPVGDLFDVVAHGDEAFSPEMAIHFENAKRLYQQKLLPMLEQQHGVRRDELDSLPWDDVTRKNFRNDDRLIKTLLLSALVPEVEALRGLNAEKLAALNHGTIRTPIPGQEKTEVLRRCRHWAAAVGEIRVGEEANPRITVFLSGVDTESIIEQARREDNQGNRIRRVRQMLFEQLGVEGEAQFEQHHDFLWRNTRRSCTVVFGNIRDLPESSLENSSDDWKLVIDFPFDEAGFSPRDDVSKLQKYLQTHPAGTRSLCWIPSFFSHDAQKDLGLLVILEHVLAGERFGQFSNHLSPQDRQVAKVTLENQRNQLRQRVQNHLDAAYGLDALSKASLDTSYELEKHEQYVSLSPGFVPLPPVAADLKGAMEHLLHQALAYQYPAAPAFEAEVRVTPLKKIAELLIPAAQEVRLPVDRMLRPLFRQIANPLLLGNMGADDTYFLIGRHWQDHLSRKAASGDGSISVAQLRHWIEDPKPLGLPREAQNLIILLYAAQTNRSLYRHGGPYDQATIQTIPDDCELRSVSLPDQRQWESALARAASIFGLTPSPLRSAGNVSAFVSDLKTKALECQRGCQAYVQRLKERLLVLGIDVETAPRLKTAVATSSLLDRLHAADVKEVIGVLANAVIETSEAAMAECATKAAAFEGNLNAFSWDLLDAARGFVDDRKADAGRLLNHVQDALTSDEHVLQLAPALKQVQAQAVRLITAKNPPPEPRPPIGPPPEPRPSSTSGGGRTGLSTGAALTEIQTLQSIEKAGRSIVVDLSWRFIDGGAG